MELIIKPTIACNFACTFCSAGTISYDSNYDRKNVPEVLKDYINKLKPDHLIITGGDPLMMDPEYYYQLYDLIKDNERKTVRDTSIAMTTNLKDFYLNPDKWTPLFNEPWMGVGTSFQYGSERRWDKDTIYTEEMFMKVQELFKERVGHYAFFIAIINEENEDTVLDLCKLAKKLDVRVKINNMLCVGRYSNATFPKYKMYQKYFEIIDAGYQDYEVNCVERDMNRCPKNCYGSCPYLIHCAYVDENGELKISICDEQMTFGNYLDESMWFPGDFNPDGCQYYIKPEEYITPECPYCNLFGICNGCKTNRDFAKIDPHYCEEMKKIEDKIIDYGWRLS